MIREWDLARTNMQRLIDNQPDVAVIPTAAIEPHNRHLPEGQDMLHTSYIAAKCCQLAWQKTKKVIGLPAIPYGVDCNLLDFPMAIHVSQRTLDAMLTDIIFSLRHHGIQKIVIINGHGGNDFAPLIRGIQCELDVYLFQSDWWKAGLDQYDNIFELPEDHAGEMETSVALALYPELVEMEFAGKITVPPFRFEAMQKGWIRSSRNFSKLNEHCASAEPSKATAEKGKQYLDLVIERITQFLIELAESTIDNSFPHLTKNEEK
jgi:creatinine amidohydrolase